MNKKKKILSSVLATLTFTMGTMGLQMAHAGTDSELPCFGVAQATAKALKNSIGSARHLNTKITLEGITDEIIYRITLTGAPELLGNGTPYVPTYSYDLTLDNDSASTCLLISLTPTRE